MPHPERAYRVTCRSMAAGFRMGWPPTFKLLAVIASSRFAGAWRCEQSDGGLASYSSESIISWRADSFPRQAGILAQITPTPEIEARKTLPPGTIGMAGVFWVASELARRNWIAFPTVRNQKGVDIIATTENRRDTKFIEIQVKTSQKKAAYWLVAKLKEDIPVRESLFYVFVRPQPQPKSPYAPFEAFVVPSARVRSDARHSEHGTFRLGWYLKDNDNANTWKDRWDIL
ncbi:MAG: hypothetical protein LAO18_01195 [Acidobacteriia bacterium]|nr:hypothetical protein [Terriglobia bacterium]